MKLRLKVGLILLLVFLLYGIIGFGIQRFIIFPSFLSIENDEAIKNSKRVVEAIEREIHYLDLLCHDWAAWDDTYDFIESLSEEYIETNLVITSFTNNNLNLIYFCDTSGKIIWGEIHNLETEKIIQLSDFPNNAFPKTHPLIDFNNIDNKPLSGLSNSGIYLTSKGPMLIASRPILNSNNEGPIRGTFIMGRFLNESIVNTLVSQTAVDFKVYTIQPDTLSIKIKDVLSRFSDKSKYVLETHGEDQLDVYTTLSDIKGHPAILIRSKLQRKITGKGKEIIGYAMYYVLASGLGVLIVMLLLLQRTVLKPITKLTNHTLLVTKTGDLSTRLSIQRQDEIGILASKFDDMLIQLANRSAELETLNAKLQKDILERKRAEERLRENEEKLVRSKKMESLGLLAGGVAHDLNNILSGIVSYPELLLMDLPEDSKFRNPIQTIQDSGKRAEAIVQDLLTIARGVAIPKQPLNLNDIIKEYEDSPELKKLGQIHPTVEVKTALDKNLMNVNGSPIHIRKIIMNLVSNASESIEGSGNVIISTTNLYVDKPIRGYEDVKMGEYVVLTISGDGSGIQSDHLERIFDPFFTKKIMGRSGTGLGLTVVWNIVQDHEGYIDVSSDEKGTKFDLYFPITRNELPIKDLPVYIEDYKGSGETVLVVDDEVSQREITCKMLDTLGYKAEAVSSGEEAVVYMQEQSVDIILLDMIMDPGINGRETYERILKIHPKQKAVIVSGFAETEEVKKTQRLGAGRYIKKPLTLLEIGLAIKEELTKS